MYPRATGNPSKISELLIDDELVVLKVLSRELTAEDYSVTSHTPSLHEVVQYNNITDQRFFITRDGMTPGGNIDDEV
jgi:CheY-like chemotaxis protein